MESWKLKVRCLSNTIRNVDTSSNVANEDLSKIKCDIKFDDGVINIGKREVGEKERPECNSGVVYRLVEILWRIWPGQ